MTSYLLAAERLVSRSALRRLGVAIVVVLAIGVAPNCATPGAAHGRALPGPGLGLVEAGRIRQASNAVLAPAGDQLAYILGDSLLVAATGTPGISVRPAPASRRLIDTGVADEASTPVPFLAWSPDGRRLLYRRGGSGPAGVPMLATLDALHPPRPLLPDAIARGLATFQNSLAGGPTWSPDGRRVALLAARRTDPAFTLQVYVADVDAGTVERWTPEGQSRFDAVWSPDGRWLAYTSGSLGPNAERPGSTVSVVDARPGAARTPVVVLTDTASLLHALRWSTDGQLLLAQDRNARVVAARFIADAAGAPPRGEPVVHALPRRTYAGWLPDGAGGRALLTAVPDGMSARLAVVAFPSGRVTRLTGPDTLATPIGVANGFGTTRVAYQLEAGSLPSDVWVASLDARRRPDASAPPLALGAVRNVTQANPWLGPDRLPATRIVRWTSGAGDTLQAQLFLPRPQLRATRPRPALPLVIVPYGGYRNQFPRSEYFLDRGLLPLVAAGYAVVRPNTRGTATDDRDRGQYGRPQLEDTERLLDVLVAEGTVDPQRVAVVGHSHGGAMAYYYLTHARRFCAVVAVNGRADWVLQATRAENDGVLPDAFGATPAERPDVYRAFSPAANARAVTAPLLAVAGAEDTQILPANVAIMADSLRMVGRPVETLVFPDEGHLLLKEANVTRFWDRAFATLTRGCGPAGR